MLNITTLATCLDSVIQTLDHRNIDLDVEYFTTAPSTAENICVYIFDAVSLQLKATHDAAGLLPPAAYSLFSVRVHETEKNYAEYFGASV